MVDLTNYLPKSIKSSLRDGGTLVTGDLIGDTNALQFGDLVQLSAKSHAAYSDPDYRIIFEGHVVAGPETVDIDRFTTSTPLKIGTANYLLDGYLQAIGFSDAASPANPHQITDLTISKCVAHILQYHCNAIYNATKNPGGPVVTTYFDHSESTPLGLRNTREGNSLWQRIQEICGGESGGEFFTPYFDTYNRFWNRPTPAFRSTPPASAMTLTTAHIREPISLTFRNASAKERIGQVKLSTVNSAGSVTTYNSVYPASRANGKIYSLTSGVYAGSQGRSDDLAEYLYRWLTRPYTVKVAVDPGLVLFGADGKGLQVGTALTLQYNGPTEGAGLHVAIDHKFYVYETEVQFDLDGKAGAGSITLEADN